MHHMIEGVPCAAERGGGVGGLGQAGMGGGRHVHGAPACLAQPAVQLLAAGATCECAFIRLLL